THHRSAHSAAGHLWSRRAGRLGALMDFLTGLLQAILQTTLSPITAAFVIAAIGLNIHFGFTGLMNIGQAGFMLVGGYGFVISIMSGLGFLPAILISMVASALFALLL